MRYLMPVLFTLSVSTPMMGCSSDSGGDGPADLLPAGKKERSDLDAFINSIAPMYLPPEAPVKETTVDIATEALPKEDGGDRNYVCTYSDNSGTQHYQNLVAFDPQADVLWPGALVQGSSLSHGLLAPIGLPRAPGKVTVTNVNVTGESTDPERYSRTVESPSQASVQEAVADIFSSAQGIKYAAKVDYTAERVHSLGQAAYAAGFALDWMGADVQAKFNRTWSKEKTNFMVRFTQAYYTVSFESPSSPASLFAPTVTAEDARHFMGDGNPPTYLSSVVYGRMLLLRIESSASESVVEGALSVALKKFGGEVSADVDTSTKEVLDTSKLTLFAVGGSADDVLEIASGGFNELQAYFSKGANFTASSPGVPISYTARYLRDSQAATVAYATDYATVSCHPKANKIRLFVDSIRFNKNGDLVGKGENDYKVWLIYGQTSLEVAQANDIKASDGETFNIDTSQDFDLFQETGAKFEVKFWANDTGSGSNEDVTAARMHEFNLPSDTWSDATEGQTLQDVDGQLDVTLKYNLQIVD